MIPVAELLRRLETSRAELLAAVAGLDAARFAARPAPGGWSVSQVCEHLARVDESLTRGLVRAVAGPDGPPVRWTDRVRQLPYHLGMVENVRARTSAPHDPRESAPRSAMLPRLAATRDALRAALAANAAADLSRWSLPHPIFGRMAADEMVALIAWHERRHRRQIARILASPPAA